ncbi:MAG: PSD1 and planctomycete cytochrome C domain-containing protein [Pirellulales bacterium]|nr:PSD1 and planctomycete cytochrome C domain-containing protein [Pirellulales bacterium]
MQMSSLLLMNTAELASSGVVRFFRDKLFAGMAVIVLLCAGTTCLGETPQPSSTPLKPIDFATQILPILQDRCMKCHDDRQKQGGLRLDVKSNTFAGGESGEPAIVPGKSAASPLLARIMRTDKDSAMPPDGEGDPLSAEQISLIRDWIEQGANWPDELSKSTKVDHWAFQAPVRPALPDVNAFTAAEKTAFGSLENPIDALVAIRLRQNGLQPAPQADRATLLRRLSLDLTGLPPTIAELDAFLADSAPEAYEKQVERLLASPHFGERWARWWLDAARYSDTDGYEKDLPRIQWPWRDWVIRALNRDLPYDQFIIQQLAGDIIARRQAEKLTPAEIQDLRVATGFLRNSMVSEEGAIIYEQYRLEGLFDRMDCLGKAVLGVTLQCAQCHTHKFDPIRHEEYYKLLAYLNNDYEAFNHVYSADEQAKIAELQRDIAATADSFRAAVADWAERLANWEQTQRDQRVAWQPLKGTDAIWEGGLAHPEILTDASILTLGFRPTTGELRVTAPHPAGKVTALRLEALLQGDLPFNGPGRSIKGTFAISELEIEQRPAGTQDAWTRIPIKSVTADFAEAERPLEEFFRKGNDDKRVVGPASFLADGKEDTAWGCDRGPGRRHTESTAVLTLGEGNGVTFDKPVELRVTLKYRHGGNDAHGRHNQFLGRFRLSVTDQPAAANDTLSQSFAAMLSKNPSERAPAEQATIFAAWLASARDSLASEDQSPFAQAVLGTTDKIAAFWRDYPEGTSVLNLAVREGVWQRQTPVYQRGDWQKPGRTVAAGTPAFLHPLASTTPADRLELATWLVDRRSPTTARVAVNRVWQTLFGQGLVDTPEDFGVRASLPHQPELLDWLAVEFMEPSLALPLPLGEGRGEGSSALPLLPTEGRREGAWSLKRLLRLIVLSRTYRQSSAASRELLDRDPTNRLLARGPRFRLESEVIRDVAISAAGLRHDQIGGPSFFPPVPDSLFSQSYLAIDFWKTATAPERYRRSLYMFRRRSMPDPVMASFDAPTGETACVRRPRSNTPLAALTSLNETVFVEAAQALALRVLREAPADDAARTVHLFRLCTARTPQEPEIAEIARLMAQARARIADGWVIPREIAFGANGDIPPLPENVTPADVAAWTVAARIVLNLDETLSKN